MKKIFYLISLVVLFTFSAGLQAQNPVNLDAASFAAKMKQMPNSQIIDVRTSGEFSQGHIKYAKNIDISSNDFQQNAAKLDKNKPVFVYCLTGSRSAYASNALSSMGFKEIYNLAGGMMRWRAANLPETTDNATAAPVSTGMTMAQYRALLNSNKLLLVDFYADWCVPCQKMKPYLNDISKEMKEKVVVVRIDAEANKALAKELKVDALPALYLYKGKKLVWSAKTYVTKETLVKTLKAN
jgi:rhodanese-related sulfurtransferase/thioredoxin-related protein